MPASLRDQQKPRPQRLGEVLTGVHEKVGQADGQVILSGCDPAVGTVTTGVNVAAGEVVLAGSIAALPAQVSQVIPAGAATAAGTFRKVLIEQDAAGAVTMTPGAAVTTAQADAKLPAGDPTKIVTGFLELPAAFDPGTTVVTLAMCKSGRTLYHA